ncbi:kinase-like protein [Gloeophyllum trabeum ATCC 11539]|uniref:non-specific serine/threonine protein kinase n=1 Tax=Gloeophyllum trabeum (strain ATCC 11539 / FP-39264 / Madison 617) TaxID=670483 RepID=S7Q4R9_GLOTA|nr:kinase-like protein [Gloeophyllum trabeum ATCC 11539]EPQ55006.1 kinase-like protein [Gloeophyllum trabeum ATCC 11539]
MKPLLTTPGLTHQPHSAHIYRSLPLLGSDVPVEEEGSPNYNPRHFYPTRLGEVLQDSYEVVAKLGFGGNSTVWLARDLLRYRFPQDRYVALKICRNDTAHAACASKELSISQHIAAANPWHPALRYVRTVKDSFELDGPHGRHLTMVYEPMREPLWLFQYRRLGGVYPAHLLKPTVRILLYALDYLHTQAHVIHTDIKAENILLALECTSVLDDLAADEQHDPSPRKILADRSVYLSRNDFGPLRTLPKFIRISDFDVAVRGDSKQPLTHWIQPDDFRAPEVTLGAPWSYSADMWNVGAMLWNLLEGETLCAGRDARGEYDAGRQLAQITSLLGPAPKALLQRGSDTELFYDSDGDLKGTQAEPRALEDTVHALEGEDKALFLDFAGRMLRWLPEERATAGELLEHPWLSSPSTPPK